MGSGMPSIIERFPEHGARILRERFRVKAIDDLCRDYDMVNDALKAVCDRGKEDVECELKRLARELEDDMLRWLTTHPDKDQRPRE